MRNVIVAIGLLLVSCHYNYSRSIIVGNKRAEGIISQDGIYDGHIRFYDLNTNKLLEEGDYKQGKKNGKYKEYNDKGILIAETSFTNDKENGIAKIFDDSGIIVAQDYYYFGLHAGNSIRFKNGKINSYMFYSFDNSILIQFDYDSLKRKRLPEIISNFYYYTKTSYLEDVTDSHAVGTKYFIYLPNPPLEEFNYSLVKVDNKRNILSTLRKFDKNKLWDTFEYTRDIHEKDTPTAIYLKIHDSINNININVIRVL